jgi:Fic family protein
LAVFNQLKEEIEPISLQELLQKLGKGYAERSVRRWLAEMVKSGRVEKFGDKKATKYKLKTSLSLDQEIKSSCFGLKSLEIIQQIKLPLYERIPVSYATTWFESYQPNTTFYLPLNFREQLHKTGKRSKQQDAAGTYAHQIFNRLLIDLSYNSSRLEGNTYSLLETQKLLLEGKGAEGKLDEEKIMILNHKEAIRYLVDTAPKLEVTKQTICTVHYLLSDGLVEAHHSGKVRNHAVRIGGSTYIPYEDHKKIELQLQKIAEKAAKIEDPYEQSLFLLVHVSYLQAFSDVNKRTARLCANIPLIKNNLVPLSFNDIEREDYTSAMLAVYELQELHPMIDLYLFSYMRTSALYDSTVASIGFDEIRVRYRQQRRHLISEIILNRLVGSSLLDYINAKINAQGLKLVEKNDRTAFIEDLLEDLREIDQSRISGLGITSEELKSWQEAVKKYPIPHNIADVEY